MPGIDLAEGRRRRPGLGSRVVTAAGTLVRVLQADPTRVLVILTAESNGFHIWLDSSADSSKGRIIQLSTFPPLILDVETYGGLVTGEIWVDATTTPCAINSFTIVDTLYTGSREISYEPSPANGSTPYTDQSSPTLYIRRGGPNG